MPDRVEAARKARTNLFGAYAAAVERICDHGERIYIFDDRGKRYLDFSAVPMTCCIGYGNQRVAEAADDQIRKIQLC